MASILILIVLSILAIDAGIAYWMVNLFVKVSDPSPRQKIYKNLAYVVLFLVLAFLTFYLIVVNFRFQR